MKSVLETAIAYTRRGWPVFPIYEALSDGSCACGKPECEHVGKHPCCPHGLDDATADPERVTALWGRHSTANIGIRTGATPKGGGFIVLDVDPRHDGDKTLEQLQRNNEPLPSTLEAITGGGGCHLLFQHPGGYVKSDNRGKLLGPGLDLKGDGGYIVAPPSRHKSGLLYQWKDACGPDDLELTPLPPWLRQLILRPEANLRLPTTPALAEAIGDGQRNSTLASLGGTMRRRGMGFDAIHAALVQENKLRCKPPLDESEVRRIAVSVSRYEPGVVPEDLRTPQMPDIPEVDLTPTICTARQLMQQYPAMNPYVIDSIIRLGEIANLVAAAKRGKTHLLIEMALAVVTERMWLSRFRTSPGKVLYIDNELHKPTIAQRIPLIAEARGIGIDEYADDFHVESMRGRLRDIYAMQRYFDQVEPDMYKLIIIDSLYRALPAGIDENSNADVTAVYNTLDGYADHLKAAFVAVHHSSKGSQSNKAVVDVGAGAGAQARAVDSHIVLRQHEQDDVVVMEAGLRSFPPLQPLCLRWSYPLWNLDESLDPSELRREGSRRNKRGGEGKQVAAEPSKAPEWTTELFVQEFLKETPQDKQTVIALAAERGVSNRKAENAIRVALATQKAYIWSLAGSRSVHLATVEQPVAATGGQP